MAIAKYALWTGSLHLRPEDDPGLLESFVEHINNLYDTGVILEAYGQQEQAPGGRRHVQYCLRLSFRRRLTGVKKLFSEFNFLWAEHVSSWDACKRYVTKDDTRIDGTEFALCHVKANNKDTSALDKAGFAGSKINSIVLALTGLTGLALTAAKLKMLNDDPSCSRWLTEAEEVMRRTAMLRIVQDRQESGGLFLADKHPKMPLRKWQKSLMQYLNTEPDDRTIVVVLDDKGGSGKTTFINMYVNAHSNVNMMPHSKTADMLMQAMNHPESKVVFMDVARSAENKDDAGKKAWFNYAGIEQVKNAVFVNSKYKTLKVQTVTPHVVIMMNWVPDYSQLSTDRWLVLKINQANVDGTPEWHRVSPPSGYDAVTNQPNPPATYPVVPQYKDNEVSWNKSPVAYPSLCYSIQAARRRQAKDDPGPSESPASKKTRNAEPSTHVPGSHFTRKEPAAENTRPSSYAEHVLQRVNAKSCNPFNRYKDFRVNK